MVLPITKKYTIFWIEPEINPDIARFYGWKKIQIDPHLFPDKGWESKNANSKISLL